MAQLHDLTALEAAAAVRRREVSPVELVEHALDRIERLDEQLGAFVTVTADAAREQAKRGRGDRACGRGSRDPAAAARRADRDQGPQPDQGRSHQARLGQLCRLRSPIDDYIVEMLRAAGTISLGKTATPEFGLPCYTETDIGPPTRTPWDPSRLAGGSSGGAAAAVAAGFAPARPGQRRRRVDPHPGQRLRPGRAQDRRADGSRAGPLDVDADPAVRARRRSPARSATRPRSSTRSRFRSPAIRTGPLPSRRARPSSAGATATRGAAHRPIHRARRSSPRSIPRCGGVGAGQRACSPGSATRSTDIAPPDPAGGGPALRDGVGGVGGSVRRSIRPARASCAR